MRIAGPRSDYPAAVLFSDFDRVCKATSLLYYQEHLGRRFKKSELHPIGGLLERREKEDEAGKALDRYFQVHVPVMRPLPLPEEAGAAPDDPRDCIAKVRQSREEMLEQVEQYKDLSKRFVHAEQAVTQTNEALALYDVGIRIAPGTFGLATGDVDEAEDKLDRARPGLAHLALRMLTFENAASERMAAALQLLHLPQIQQRFDNGEQLWLETRQIFPESRFISGLMGEMPTLRILFRRVLVLLYSIPSSGENRELFDTILDQMERLHKRLRTIQKRLKGQYYPLDHHKADMTLKEYALPVLPSPQDPGHLADVTSELFEKLSGLQIRLFARLAFAAEQVEKAIGLEPLPEPKLDDDDEK